MSKRTSAITTPLSAVDDWGYGHDHRMKLATRDRLTVCMRFPSSEEGKHCPPGINGRSGWP
jgi:hypothetical protein